MRVLAFREGEYICQCTCLLATFFVTKKLDGRKTHCGCKRKSHIVKLHSRTGYQSKTYTSWRNMLRKRNTIQVQDTWMVFINFLEDLGRAPTNTRLYRKDKALGFVQGNVEWRRA